MPKPQVKVEAGFKSVTYNGPHDRVVAAQIEFVKGKATSVPADIADAFVGDVWTIEKTISSEEGDQ